MRSSITPKIMLSVALLMSMSSYKVAAQTFSQTAKVVAADRKASDNLGNNVSISGNYMVATARNQDFDAAGANAVTDAGAVYVYERNATTGAWVQIQKLVASDRSATDQFGWSVSISGDHIVVGAWQQDKDASGANTLTDAGAAYIFERNASTGVWSQVQKIVASDRVANDKFGYSVSVSGDRVVVSAWWQDLDASGANSLNNAGAAYVYDRDASTGVWAQTQKLVAGDRTGNDQYGTSVSVDGNHIVVGAYQQTKDEAGNNFMNMAGAAYIYERDASTGVWAQVQKIVASDRAASDFYGNSVSVSGDRIVVGAKMQDTDPASSNFVSSAGAAYVYERNSSTGVWNQVQKLVNSDRVMSDWFGFYVGISGDRIVVGADMQDLNTAGSGAITNAGGAYLYQRNASTGVWSQTQKLVQGDRAANDNFGFTVAISGDKVAVGALAQDQNTTGSSALTDAGAAYIFELKEGGNARQVLSQSNAYFRISPVPAVNVFTIETNNTALEGTTATIADVTGKSVYSFVVATGRQEVGISSLVPGMYTVQLSDGSSYKLIKE